MKYLLPIHLNKMHRIYPMTKFNGATLKEMKQYEEWKTKHSEMAGTL
jgi:hypothetical protein